MRSSELAIDRITSIGIIAVAVAHCLSGCTLAPRIIRNAAGQDDHQGLTREFLVTQ